MVEADSSVIDNARLITLALAADDGPAAWLLNLSTRSSGDFEPIIDHQRTLYLRCARHELSAYIYLGLSEAKGRFVVAPGSDWLSRGVVVKLRSGQREPQSEIWSYSRDLSAMFSPNPEALISQLARSDTLMLQYDLDAPDSASMRLDRPTLIFNLAKLDRHLPFLRSECP
jgi:hypothetical protein